MRFVSSTYDQENRLIRVTTANGNRSEFSYDGMSRRIETRDYQANSLMLTTRYVYDGVLPLAELNGSNVTTRTITRGTDLSGSMQGAGGIGGILATNGNEYSYDGNGNVRDIISASGLNVAHYEYDPFGNKTVSSGSYSSQPYQWSSKEFHQPSGMVYYLYRFYSPQLCRWINRDPIEEAGGINLYGFVGNDGVNSFDALGLLTLQGTLGAPIVVRLTVTADWEKDQNCCWKVEYSAEAEVGLGAAVGAKLGKAFSFNVGAMLAGLGKKRKAELVVCPDGSVFAKGKLQIINFSKFLDQGVGLGSNKVGFYFGAGVALDIEIDLNVTVVATMYAADVTVNISGHAEVTSGGGLTFGDFSVGGPPKSSWGSSFINVLIQRTIRFQ